MVWLSSLLVFCVWRWFEVYSQNFWAIGWKLVACRGHELEQMWKANLFPTLYQHGHWLCRGLTCLYYNYERQLHQVAFHQSLLLARVWNTFLCGRAAAPCVGTLENRSAVSSYRLIGVEALALTFFPAWCRWCMCKSFTVWHTVWPWDLRK